MEYLEWDDILDSVGYWGDYSSTVYLMSSSEYKDDMVCGIRLDDDYGSVNSLDGGNVICYKYMEETVVLFLAY